MDLQKLLEDIDAAYHQLIIAKAKDAAEGKLVKTSGSNPGEATYNAAVTANPDKSVMHPIATELTEAGYTDAKKAVKQGEILEKVFSGEDITDAELDALDLNNEAVRTVFANRSGLTGMKDAADFTRELKRTYVAEAVKNVRDLKATQDAAGTASQNVM